MFPYTLVIALLFLLLGLYFMQKTGRIAKYLRFVAVACFLVSPVVFSNCTGSSCNGVQTLYVMQETDTLSREVTINSTAFMSAAGSVGPSSSGLLGATAPGPYYDSARYYSGTIFQVPAGKQVRITSYKFFYNGSGGFSELVNFGIGFSTASAANSSSVPSGFALRYLGNYKSDSSSKYFAQENEVNVLIPANDYITIRCGASCWRWNYVLFGTIEPTGTNVTSTIPNRVERVGSWSLTANTYTVPTNVVQGYDAINFALATYTILSLVLMQIRKWEQ